MILILSGSSCSGKNTIIKKLTNLNEDVKLIPTFTTRDKRPNETEGNPYHYLTKSEFQNKIKKGDFFEHELIHNNFYGVEKNYCNEMLKSSKHLIKDLGVIGTFNLKENLQDSYVETVFLYVNKCELKRRLIQRGDDKKDIKLRLKRFKFEKSYINRYNFLIENYDLNKTVKILNKLIELNNEKFYEYIEPLRDISCVNFKKLNQYCDKMINNKRFKPLNVYFNGKDFYLKDNIELYLASVLTNKNVTKKIIFKEVAYDTKDYLQKVVDFIKNNEEN